MISLATVVIGPVEFAQPMWLWLVPVTVAVVVLLARKSLSAGATGVRYAAVTVRVLVVLLILGAMAEPSWRRVSDKLAVTAVLDMSRSVPVTKQSLAEDFIASASAINRSENDLLGGVTAARDAYVQAIPSDKNTEIEPQTIGSTEGTNLEDAVRMALAIRPEDAAYRLVLITDGNETVGSLNAAAESARAMGVPIDVLPLTYRYEGEVIVEKVETPTNARMGDIISARVTMRSTRQTKGTLNILINGTPIDLDPSGPGVGTPVQVEPGSQTFSIPLAMTRRGPQEITAVFEPDEDERGIGDVVDENNRASSITFFSGEGRVLVLSESPKESVDLVSALESARIGVDSLSAESAPDSLIGFNAYDAVVLCNVPAYALSEAQQRAIKQYVEDGGGGLVMTGGPDSFGAGGWIGSPVEDVLPVQLDPPQSRQMPRGALVLIMHSIEMPEGVFYGKKTAEAAANALSRLDLIGIVEYTGFGGDVKWVYPLSERGDGSAVRSAINRLAFGDMPSMHSSVVLAYKALAPAPAGQKHAIIVSDGDPSPPSKAILQKYVDSGITISTIGVFPHNSGISSPDLRRLQDIAEFTGGRYYSITSTRQLATIPKIFIKEAQTVKRSLIWEGDPFTPNLTGMPSEAMSGVTSVPPIKGYVVTADRQDGLAIVTMRGPQDDPILAQWQRGLGRVVAFTSDVTTRWSPAWSGWSGYQAFWSQHVRWVMRPTGSAEARARIEQVGDESVLTVDLAEADSGERINFARITGRVAGPDGSSREVVLQQEGPGRYVGRFPSDLPGSYIVGLRYAAPATDARARIEGTIQAALTKPFTDEFRALEDNAGLLRQIAERTGGRVLSEDAAQANLWLRDGLEKPVSRQPIYLAVMLAAVAMFLVDVAIRRVRIDLGVLAAVWNKLFLKAPEQETESVRSLRAARAKAQAKMRPRSVADA
ncbi:MAG TPA: VWA domain-containing protein, partial [Phycisphaerales bacterium]|nr:VWA domain-containing protein [Phycisphaerales bacterium]